MGSNIVITLITVITHEKIRQLFCHHFYCSVTFIRDLRVHIVECLLRVEVCNSSLMRILVRQMHKMCRNTYTRISGVAPECGIDEMCGIVHTPHTSPFCLQIDPHQTSWFPLTKNTLCWIEHDSNKTHDA